jgi:putative endonuclease
MHTLVYIYIIQSIDGSYHTGCCDELTIVLAKYDKYKNILKNNKITLPIKLVHHQKFQTEHEASIIANEIRRWTKQEKQFLINNDWPEISKLAKRFN